MLTLLPADQGPARLRLFQRSHHGMQQELRGLTGDLPRTASVRTRLSVVQFPVAALDGWDDARLARWCQQPQDWPGRRSRCCCCCAMAKWRPWPRACCH